MQCGTSDFVRVSQTLITFPSCFASLKCLLLPRLLLRLSNAYYWSILLYLSKMRITHPPILHLSNAYYFPFFFYVSHMVITYSPVVLSLKCLLLAHLVVVSQILITQPPILRLSYVYYFPSFSYVSHMVITYPPVVTSLKCLLLTHFVVRLSNAYYLSAYFASLKH
jgi:hypothetical protein